ncbi:response regulator [Ammoniphilus sp. 3BR4]|uniref:response regulator n=1 Tax=Ammoniphilus sp. 3BR4 TaxID=3158265 RepID=UPI003465D3DA
MIQVLIIEDDIRIAEINRRFIDKVPDFQVIGIATTKEQAMEQIEILQPDLVLLDVYLPDMNGLEFMSWIQQEYPNTDVIMITAAKEVHSVREAIRKGAFDYLVKPLIFDRFKETMMNYREFRLKLTQLKNNPQTMGQEDIDSLLQGSRKLEQREAYLPKGIDQLTLEKVSLAIKEESQGLTAEEVSQKIGASRSTARRYLEYLVSKGALKSDLSYGVVGRPERIYRNVYAD